MDAIVGGRRTGKTTALVNWYKEQPGNRVIVVMNSQIANWLQQEYDIPSKDILITATTGVHLRGRHSDFGVDNLEFILTEYFGQTPSVVTFTGSAYEV